MKGQENSASSAQVSLPVVENPANGPEKNTKNKILFISLWSVAGILVIIFIVLLIILSNHKSADNNSQNSDNSSNDGESIVVVGGGDGDSYDRGKPINFDAIDFDTVGGEVGYLYISRLLKTGEKNVYLGSYDSDGNLDVQQVMEKIDKIIEEQHITNEVILSMIRMERIQTYINAGLLDDAAGLLSDIGDTRSMKNCELYYYYITYYNYYSAIGDTETANEMLKNLEALPAVELG